MRSHTRPASTRPAPPRHSGDRLLPGRGSGGRRDAGHALCDLAVSEELAVEVRRDLPRPLITVAGELDLASAGLLTAMLDHVRTGSRRRSKAARPAEVDVDLSAVTFADSSGLAPVLESGIQVVAVSEPVRRLLHLLRDLPTEAVPRAQQDRAIG